jgi:hypothetical protein
MPIEIRELVIKVNANQPRQEGGEGSSAPADVNGPAQQPGAEKLVADAVEQVMDILRNKNER